MDSLEKIYNDKRAWSYFKIDENETIGVYRRCTQCSRYISMGKLLTNMAGEVKLTGWTCKIHGEIEPYYDREC